MCKHGETQKGIDKCIYQLVIALNNAKITTEASCCGHGHQLGNIALADGRLLEIYPNKETWDKLHPDISGKTIHGEIIGE